MQHGDEYKALQAESVDAISTKNIQKHLRKLLRALNKRDTGTELECISAFQK